MQILPANLSFFNRFFQTHYCMASQVWAGFTCYLK
jgi:hypothetical protein